MFSEHRNQSKPPATRTQGAGDGAGRLPPSLKKTLQVPHGASHVARSTQPRTQPAAVPSTSVLHLRTQPYWASLTAGADITHDASHEPSPAVISSSEQGSDAEPKAHVLSSKLLFPQQRRQPPTSSGCCTLTEHSKATKAGPLPATEPRCQSLTQRPPQAPGSRTASLVAAALPHSQNQLAGGGGAERLRKG